MAVSNDAVRNQNEVAVVAPMLGLDPDSVRAALPIRAVGVVTRRQHSGVNGQASSNGANQTPSWPALRQHSKRSTWWIQSSRGNGQHARQ